MKKTLFIFFALICIIGISSYAWAKPITGEIGYHVIDYKDSSGKIGEYRSDHDDSAGVDFHFLGDIQDDVFYFGLDSNYYGDSEYSYWISGEYKRIFSQEFSGECFEHQLDHDLMENLSASAGGPKTSHEDLSMGEDYMIKYSKYKSATVLKLPFLSGTQLDLNYSNQKRKGHRQSSSISHCAGCHVVSKTREINEETEDFKIGITKKFDWISVAYDYFHREFNENSDTPESAYDDPKHPANGKVWFDDRVSYGDETLPYDLVPSMEKNTHTIKTRVELPVDTVLFTSYVHSSVENKNSDLEIESNIISARATNNSVPGLKLVGKFRHLNIINDNVDVDINEPLCGGGKNDWNKDYPYDDHGMPGYGSGGYNSFDPDFIRESAMSRDVTTMGLNARYYLFRKTFLNLDYEWDQIDRRNYAVDKTKTNTVKVGLTTRPHRKMKVKVGYKWQDINDPFVNVDGVCENVIFPASTGGCWVDSVQYWERQDERSADVSNQPTKVNEITTNVKWSILQSLSLSTNYQYTEKENDKTNYSDWEQKSHMLVTNLWYAPIPKLNFNLAYIYDKAKTDAFICIPVYDG